MSGERRALLILLAITLVLFSFRIGGRDLWDPDEPRYAGVARSILESGDWLRLTDNGQPYTHKPPLYFWILAAAGRLAGEVTPASSRLPAAVFGLLCVALTYRLGRDLFSVGTGLAAGVVLATTQRFFLESRWVHIDVLLTFLTLLGMDAIFRALEQGEKWRWGVAYAAMALGCLAKGPVAVAFPVTGVLVYLASVGELRRLWESGFLWGAAGSLLPTGIWLWAASPRGGPDAWAVIQTQVLERVGRGMHHPRPIFYYLYSLPLEFLPWTPFLAGAVAVTFPSRQRGNRRTLLFLYAWLVGGLALLSASVEKRPGYLLPLLPILSLLVGRLLADHVLGHDPRKLRRWIEVPLAGYAALVAVGGTWVLARAGAYPGLFRLLLPLVLLYFTACAGAAVLLRNRRRELSLMVFCGGLIAGYLQIAGGVLPWLNAYKSARPFGERVVGRIGDSPLAVYRDPRPALAYYTHRSLPVLRTPASVRQWLAGPRNGYVLIEGGDFEAVSKSERLRVLDREAVGEKIYLLAAREPDPATGGSPR